MGSASMKTTLVFVAALACASVALGARQRVMSESGKVLHVLPHKAAQYAAEANEPFHALKREDHIELSNAYNDVHSAYCEMKPGDSRCRRDPLGDAFRADFHTQDGVATSPMSNQQASDQARDPEVEGYNRAANDVESAEENRDKFQPAYQPNNFPQFHRREVPFTEEDKQEEDGDSNVRPMDPTAGDEEGQEGCACHDEEPQEHEACDAEETDDTAGSQLRGKLRRAKQKLGCGMRAGQYSPEVQYRYLKCKRCHKKQIATRNLKRRQGGCLNARPCRKWSPFIAPPPPNSNPQDYDPPLPEAPPIPGQYFPHYKPPMCCNCHRPEVLISMHYPDKCEYANCDWQHAFPRSPVHAPDF